MQRGLVVKGFCQGLRARAVSGCTIGLADQRGYWGFPFRGFPCQRAGRQVAELRAASWQAFDSRWLQGWHLQGTMRRFCALPAPLPHLAPLSFRSCFLALHLL